MKLAIFQKLFFGPLNQKYHSELRLHFESIVILKQTKKNGNLKKKDYGTKGIGIRAKYFFFT